MDCVHTSKEAINSTVFTLNKLETNYTKLSCHKCFLMKKRDALASIKASPGGRKPCPLQEYGCPANIIWRCSNFHLHLQQCSANPFRQFYLFYLGKKEFFFTTKAKMLCTHGFKVSTNKISCRRCFSNIRKDALASILASPGGRRSCPLQDFGCNETIFWRTNRLHQHLAECRANPFK